jgi:hypothetical protein
MDNGNTIVTVNQSTMGNTSYVPEQALVESITT